MKYGMVLTMLIWLAIAMLAKEEDKKHLNDAVRGFWPETGDRRPETIIQSDSAESSQSGR